MGRLEENSLEQINYLENWPWLKTETKTKTFTLKTKTKTFTLETETKTKTLKSGLETVSRRDIVSRRHITGPYYYRTTVIVIPLR